MLYLRITHVLPLCTAPQVDVSRCDLHISCAWRDVQRPMDRQGKCKKCPDIVCASVCPSTPCLKLADFVTGHADGAEQVVIEEL